MSKNLRLAPDAPGSNGGSLDFALPDRSPVSPALSVSERRLCEAGQALAARWQPAPTAALRRQAVPASVVCRFFRSRTAPSSENFFDHHGAEREPSSGEEDLHPWS